MRPPASGSRALSRSVNDGENPHATSPQSTRYTVRSDDDFAYRSTTRLRELPAAPGKERQALDGADDPLDGVCRVDGGIPREELPNRLKTSTAGSVQTTCVTGGRGRGEVPQNSVDLPAACSRRASSASSSSFPASTSRSSWRSHAAASNSANHRRNSASSSGDRARTFASIASSLPINTEIADRALIREPLVFVNRNNSVALTRELFTQRRVEGIVQPLLVVADRHWDSPHASMRRPLRRYQRAAERADHRCIACRLPLRGAGRHEAVLGGREVAVA